MAAPKYELDRAYKRFIIRDVELDSITNIVPLDGKNVKVVTSEKNKVVLEIEGQPLVFIIDGISEFRDSNGNIFTQFDAAMLMAEVDSIYR